MDLAEAGKIVADSIGKVEDLVRYVLDALVKVGIVWVVARVGLKFTDIRSEMKNRVSGVYMTRTAGTAWLGDRTSDDPTKVTRNLFLWQSGRGLQGIEYGQGEQAEWELEARLTDDGFVNGRYWQVTPRTGISRGAFYLEQVRKDPRRFVGQFSGWNVDSKSITSNSYEWERVKLAPGWTVVAPRALRGLWSAREKRGLKNQVAQGSL